MNVNVIYEETFQISIETLARLNRGKNFTEATINLQGIKIDKETKKEGEIINQSTIMI